MAPPVLYKMVSSPPANSVLMLADLLGIQLDTKEVDWDAMEHKSPEYLKMNPMGTIPVLKDGDFVVAESHAILKYLIRKHGPHSLYPEDLRTRTTVDQCMYFNIGIFFVKFDNATWAVIGKQKLTEKMLGDIDRAYGVIEGYLENRKFIAADHLTLADLCNGITAAFTQPIHKIDEKSYSKTMPKLWIMPFSPPSCAVKTLGQILGVKFEIVTLDYAKQEHKAPEFLKINPIGAVPLLKDEDFYLSDSHAILKYILDKYGSATQRESLYPSDLQTRALVDQVLFFDTGVLFNKFITTYVTIRTTEGLTGPTPKQREEIETAYSVIEVYIGDKEYVVSDHLTLADISLGITTAALQTMHKLDKTKFPRATAWLDRLNEIDVFRNNTRPVFELLAKSFQNS